MIEQPYTNRTQNTLSTFVTPMASHSPIWWSWPGIRHAERVPLPAEPPQDDGHLTQQQLGAWICGLIVEDGQLVITGDSLRLLPQHLPYEVFGALLLAVVDSRTAQEADASTVQQHMQSQYESSNSALAVQGCQHMQGLKIVGIDLQEPLARPLQTCLTAYSNIQQLALNHLNIDVEAAKALGEILHSSSHQSSANSSRCSLRSLALDGVFMGDLAWQALTQGLAAGCKLRSLRLIDCLTINSLQLLGAALPAGCQDLHELDLSSNLCPADAKHGRNGIRRTQTTDIATAEDAAWAQLLQGVPDGCKQLQDLCLARCSLGLSAAARLAKLLRLQPLKQLNLAHCTAAGEGMLQVLAAAACCSTLQQLDVSSTGLTDSSLKALTAPGWFKSIPGFGSGTGLLQELRLCDNRVSGVAVEQLIAKQLVSGSLAQLRILNVAGCSAVGDQGALAIASVLSNNSCSLKCLDLSGCEVTDTGALALSACVAAGAVVSPGSAGDRAGTGLHELHLADNQITGIGIQSFAAAISKPGCCLQLLDVSFNWVGPQAMKPLVAAAAAEGQHQPASSAGLPQCKLSLLRECLPEYWRVEAAKAAALQQVLVPAVGRSHGVDHTIEHLATCTSSDSSSCHTRHSCCTLAGSDSCRCNSTSTDPAAAASSAAARSEAAAAPVQQDLEVQPQQQRNRTVWTYNSLYGDRAHTLSCEPSGVADASDSCSDVCRIHADSDCLSDISSCSVPAKLVSRPTERLLDVQLDTQSPLQQQQQQSGPKSSSVSVAVQTAYSPESPATVLEGDISHAALHSFNCVDMSALESKAAATLPSAEASAADSVHSIDVGARSRQQSLTGTAHAVLHKRPQMHDQGTFPHASDQNVLVADQQGGAEDVWKQQVAVNHTCDVAACKSSSTTNSPSTSPAKQSKMAVQTAGITAATLSALKTHKQLSHQPIAPWQLAAWADRKHNAYATPSRIPSSPASGQHGAHKPQPPLVKHNAAAIQVTATCAASRASGRASAAAVAGGAAGTIPGVWALRSMRQRVTLGQPGQALTPA